MSIGRAAIALTAVVLFAASAIQSSRAMPPSPEVVDYYRSHNELNVLSDKLIRMQALGIGQTPLEKKFTSAKAHSSDTLRMRIPVILVDFSDNTADSGPVHGKTAADFQQLLFSRNAMQGQSLTDFYLENSYGNFLVEGDVYGWYRLPHTYAYYRGSNYGIQSTEPNARTMARDAVIMADADIDFSQYDSDGDGYVDGIFIVHAGPGAEGVAPPGDTLHIWSHSWSLAQAYVSNDGTIVRKYTTEPEEVLGRFTSIGVFCHEFGHTLGLPDLYDVSYTSSGIGNWGLMGNGAWNGNGSAPAHFGAWSKYALDSLYGVFGRTIDVTANTTGVTLGAASSDSVRYRIMLPTLSGREYFLIENRQKTGFDWALPGHGLLIWHCDDNLSGSNDLENNDHLRIAVEQADGKFQLESGSGHGDAYDPFPGADNVSEFTDLSNPSNASNQGMKSQIAVWGIEENATDGSITCNFDLSYSRPRIEITNLTFSDAAHGNNDGVLDPGEEIAVTFSLRSVWKAPTNVVAQLASDVPGLDFIENRFELAQMTNGVTYSNDASPLLFQIPSQIIPVKAELRLVVSTATSPDTFAAVQLVNLGGSDVLLVDDDGSGSGSTRSDQRSYYTTTLSNLQIPFTTWDTKISGTPTAGEYAYRNIIWFTGDGNPGALTHSEVEFLTGFLDQGGSLFLTGQDIAEGLSYSTDSTFLRDYLRARYVRSFVVLDAYGVNGNPVSDGLDLGIMGYDGATNQYSQDELEPAFSYSDVAFTYADSATPAGISYVDPGGNRLVFLGFGFESIRNTKPGSNTREEVMQRVIDFLRGNTATAVVDDGVDITLPSDFELNQNYPNPFNPTTVISFTVGPAMTNKPLKLEVFDVLGRKVATPFSGIASAGLHRIDFDGSNLASGVYFYRLTVAGKYDVKKMVLVK
jgi:M6 family metalloprotease-like protein